MATTVRIVSSLLRVSPRLRFTLRNTYKQNNNISDRFQSSSIGTISLFKRQFSEKTQCDADYDAAFQSAIETPEAFWAEAAENIDWVKKWDTVLDQSKNPFTKW